MTKSDVQWEEAMHSCRSTRDEVVEEGGQAKRKDQNGNVSRDKCAFEEQTQTSEQLSLVDSGTKTSALHNKDARWPISSAFI